jgi:DNA-binding MarR family transcriptional regulator
MQAGSVASSTPVDDVDGVTARVLEAWGEVDTLLERIPALVEERFGVPRHRFHVLRAVERGASRIQDIADVACTSVSAASRTVDALVREGVLDRGSDPDDRRASRVTLTTTGRERIDAVQTWAHGIVAVAVRDLGVERAGRIADDLTAFTRRMSTALERPEA